MGPIDSRVVQRLAALVGEENVLSDAGDTWPYGYDNSRRQVTPELVVFATENSEIEGVVGLCYEHRIPIVARGLGTGTTGATVPSRGGIVLSLERMDRILRVDPANRAMDVQPGVTNARVQQAAAEHGFFWPPDPTSSAYCTVGGNLAYNSAGPRAVKYGTPRENTLALKAVDGRGRSLHTGSYTTKGVVGYDLTRLLIGSEGTLAIVTEASLKLTPLPEATRSMRALYRDVEAAAAAVSSIMAQPTTPSALEFMDGRALDLVRAQGSGDLAAEAGSLLLIEVDGPEACIEPAVRSVEEAASVPGLLEIKTAGDGQERQALWAARKALSPALRSLAPKKINEDVVVPVSRMPALVRGLEELSRRYGILIVNFGHAGNGNLHTNLLVDPTDSGQLDGTGRCLSDVFDLVLSLEGSLSGEHGVGLEKRDFVQRELDEVSLDIMRRIKAQLDPRDIMNPGKMLPPES